MQLVKTFTKSKHMNSSEAKYIQEHQRKDLLVTGQLQFEQNIHFVIIKTT